MVKKSISLQGNREGLRLNGTYIAGPGPPFKFLSGLFQVRRILIEVNGGHGQDLAGVKQGLVTDGAAAGGYVLPAVAGRPVDKGGHMDLGSRRLPADISVLPGKKALVWNTGSRKSFRPFLP